VAKEDQSVRVLYSELQTKSRENFYLYPIIIISVFVAGVGRGLGLKWQFCIRRSRFATLLRSITPFPALIIPFKFIMLIIIRNIFHCVKTQSSYCVTFVCRLFILTRGEHIRVLSVSFQTLWEYSLPDKTNKWAELLHRKYFQTKSTISFLYSWPPSFVHYILINEKFWKIRVRLLT
jgi:hypothetical protein